MDNGSSQCTLILPDMYRSLYQNACPYVCNAVSVWHSRERNFIGWGGLSLSRSSLRHTTGICLIISARVSSAVNTQPTEPAPHVSAEFFYPIPDDEPDDEELDAALQIGADADVTLYLIPASTIDLIYGLLSFPVAREVGRAHVVLRFVDATTGDPIEGVTVSHVGETVSYDTGGSWSDVQTGTGSLGYAVLVNAPAQSNRTKQKVSFDTGTVSGSLDIAMQSDAITLADIAIAQ